MQRCSHCLPHLCSPRGRFGGEDCHSGSIPEEGQAGVCNLQAAEKGEWSLGTEINVIFPAGMIERKGRGVGEGCMKESRGTGEGKRGGMKVVREGKTKSRKKKIGDRTRKENTGRAEPRAGRSFAPGPCRAAQASPSPRRGAGMPFPTSTILLLCFFLACFVLSAHKPRPRVSVNSFQVPVSRHPAAPPLLATAAPAPLPPGGLSSTSAHLLWGQPRAPQPGKSRPAEC